VGKVLLISCPASGDLYTGAIPVSVAPEGKELNALYGTCSTAQNETCTASFLKSAISIREFGF